MIESLNLSGLFDVYDHTLEPDAVRDLLDHYGHGSAMFDKIFREPEPRPNTIMAAYKQQAAQLVFSNISRLVITSQSAPPADSEIGFTGTLYISNASDEVLRADLSNPYQVGWNIVSNAANGNWGSFVLIDGNGAMINRALAGVTKNTGSSKLIIFTGSVV